MNETRRVPEKRRKRLSSGAEAPASYREGLFQQPVRSRGCGMAESGHISAKEENGGNIPRGLCVQECKGGSS
jgi:hypothetical protein